MPTKLQWQDLYNNFKIQSNNQQNHPRIPLKVTSDNKENIKVEHQDLPLKRKTIFEEIGNYFKCLEAFILFNPWNDESVKDCLSRRIDLFDDILNNKVDISAIVKKACENDYQLNTKQQMADT